MTEPRILPSQQIREVDSAIYQLIERPIKWSNAEPFDEEACALIHNLAEEMYAAGYRDGRLGEQTRYNGRWSRDRDRARRAEESGGGSDD